MSKSKNHPRVAIVHDYFRTYGGGERVVEALHQIWPAAPLYVATANMAGLGKFQHKFMDVKIITSWAQRIPFFAKKPILYRFLLPLVWSSFNFDQFDIVISSSGANIAKGIRTSAPTLHFCYCHTPPRYLYDLKTESVFGQYKIFKTLLRPLTFLLKKYDLQTSDSVHFFIANSKVVAQRIKKYYQRSAEVIYPPILIESQISANTSQADQKYFLVVSRLVRHKNINLIIEVANKMGFPLVIVGTGDQEQYLKKIALTNIQFIGSISDAQLIQYYRKSSALIVASEDEDFGITAIEAMSFGIPVIAYKSGGFRETVIDQKTGVFFTHLTGKDLQKAIQQFQRLKFDRKIIRKHAQQFSQNVFQKRMKEFILQMWQKSL
jgi:glycosyltransferase involved in cell wall biosynthesis